jgi:UDP-glucose 4-epimerase
MRIVIVGATGNLGTSVLDVLRDEPRVEDIVGIARRRPELDLPRTRWVAADIASDDLVPHFRGADVVVHLAWLIQPSRDRSATRAVNQDGSARVLRAVADAGVPALVYASSVGAYSPGPKDRRVDESWPTRGIASSFYSVDKAAVEGLFDRFETEHPSIRAVRMRPALVFKRDAASGVRRLFAGPLLPTTLLRPEWIPIVPRIERLRFQAVHSLDVGEALRRAIVGDAHGAFNLAAEPVLDPPELARLLGAREVSVPAKLVRRGAALTWKLRLQPSPPGWLDMALGVPLMSTSRAREELGWAPRHSSGTALLELIEGMRAGAGVQTPPLEPGGAGPLCVRELLGGIGARTG